MTTSCVASGKCAARSFSAVEASREPLCCTVRLRAVDVRAVAEVNIAGAIRSEDEGVISERVAFVGEVEDARRDVVRVVAGSDFGLVCATVERARGRVEAGPASL